MDEQEVKCVMVVDENLPLGLIVNTAAVLGVTLGKHYPDMVGADVFDKTGKCHIGITELPIPILKGDSSLIKELRERLYDPELSDLTVVDFTDTAQSCNTYDIYTEKISGVSETDLNYYGIAIFGNKKQVNKLTGSIALFR